MWFDDSVKSKVKFADDRTLAAEGIGQVLIKRKDGKQSFITGVLYVLGMKNNLLSLSQLLEKGYVMKMEDGELKMYDESKMLILKAPLSKNRIFKVGIQVMGHKCLCWNRWLRLERGGVN